MWRRALVTASVTATAMGLLEWRGFTAGALAASALWLAAPRLKPVAPRAGAAVTAESLSRELLDTTPQWLAVHDLSIDGRTVDHVVVTPLAILSVESTWWGPAGDDVRARRREQAVERARRNAHVVKKLLASRDFGFALPVLPAVLTWGPGAEDTQVGLVDVVSGADAGAWTIAHSSGAIDDTVAEQVHAALLRYQARQDPYRTKAQHARAA
jgi:Nuclease-related domain